MGEEFQVWKKHFINQAHGLVPHQKKFYNVSEQVGRGGNASIKLVTPTQQVVERAKSTLSQPTTSEPPTVFDPVMGVMQHTAKKHNKVKTSRKRKVISHGKNSKNSKKRKISKKTLKKSRKISKKRKSKKAKSKKTRRKGRW